MPGRHRQLGRQRVLHRAQAVPSRLQVAQHAVHLVHAAVEAGAQNHQVAHAFQQGVEALDLDPQEPLAACAPIAHGPAIRAPAALDEVALDGHAFGRCWVAGQGHRQAGAAEQGADLRHAFVDAFEDAEGRRELAAADLGAQFLELMRRARHRIEADRAGRALERVQVAEEDIDDLRGDLERRLRGVRE